MDARWVQVLTTVESREAAGTLAARLVEDRLAACVQVVGPVASTYRWKGAVETAEEWLCIAKTTGERYPELERAVRGLHWYEVPEITAVPVVAGDPDYLAWLSEETTG